MFAHNQSLYHGILKVIELLQKIKVFMFSSHLFKQSPNSFKSLIQIKEHKSYSGQRPDRIEMNEINIATSIKLEKLNDYIRLNFTRISFRYSFRNKLRLNEWTQTSFFSISLIDGSVHP